MLFTNPKTFGGDNKCNPTILKQVSIINLSFKIKSECAGFVCELLAGHKLY